MKPRFTAHLVAYAYHDPESLMRPQIDAVRIYSEAATSLSCVGQRRIALDVYQTTGDTYQDARDMLCYLIQRLGAFKWCRPLMDAVDLVPIDYLDVQWAPSADSERLTAVLADMLRCDVRAAGEMLAGKRLVRDEVRSRIARLLSDSATVVFRGKEDS